MSCNVNIQEIWYVIPREESFMSNLLLWENVTPTPICEENYHQCAYMIDLLGMAVPLSRNADGKVFSTFTE